MVDIAGMVTAIYFAVLVALAFGIYALVRRDLTKRDRYRLIRSLMVGVFVGTALLAGDDPTALAGLLAQVVDRPDG